MVRIAYSLVNLAAIQVFVLCTVAQGFCITTTLTKDSWYGAIEESLWGYSFACLVPSMLFLLSELATFNPRSLRTDFVDTSQTKAMLVLILIVSSVLSVYNLYYHVPVLFNLAAQERATRKQFYSLAAGLSNALFERRRTAVYAEWEHTWDWQGAYFTFGAWFAMFLGTAPRIHIKYAKD